MGTTIVLAVLLVLGLWLGLSGALGHAGSIVAIFLWVGALLVVVFTSWHPARRKQRGPDQNR